LKDEFKDEDITRMGALKVELLLCRMINHFEPLPERRNFGRTWKFDKELITKLVQKYGVSAKDVEAVLKNIVYDVPSVNVVNDVNDTKKGLF
jgi:hypothetical protein